MTLHLITPSPAYETSYRAYLRELGDEERYPFPLDFEHADFAALLARLDALAHGVGVPEGFVPSSTFWLVDEGELLGVSNLRHYLNERIRHCGGHVGLGIRPSRRGRGLGRTLLGLTLEEARRRGIDAVQVHCHADNLASVRTILACGGVLDSEIEDGDPPRIVHRYVVDGG